MPTYATRSETRVELWIGAYSLVAIVLIVLPALVFVEQRLESSLVANEIDMVSREERLVVTTLSNRVEAAEASLRRLSRSLTDAASRTPSPAEEATFERLVGLDADGARRSRATLYDPRDQAGIWLPRHAPVDAASRAFYVRAKDIIESATLSDEETIAVNAWLLVDGGGEVILWPDAPRFIYEAAATHDYSDTDWVNLVRPENDPSGAPRWTRVEFDPVPGIWMVSVVAPITREGRFAGSVGHDVPLDHLIAGAASLPEREGGTYMVVDDEGRLLASRRFAADIRAGRGEFSVSDLGEAPLRGAVEALMRATRGTNDVQRVETAELIVLGSHLDSTGWTAISAIPRVTVTGRVAAPVRTMRAATLGALALVFLGSALTIGQDRRRRRRVLEQLRESDEKLARAQKLDVLGRFAGGIAHDFNNILTAIHSFAQVAQMRGQREDAVRDHLKQIARACMRGSELTRQLLAFARTRPIAPRVIDVNALVRDTHKLLRRVIGEDVEVRVEPSLEPATVLMDAGQLEQVLTNLAVNARDAMPNGGALTVRVEVDAASVRLTVADTGVGMPPEVREKATEPFFTTKAAGGGTGLGLSTCLAIVEQAGGTLAIASTVGEGTTFTLTFPRDERPSSEGTPSGVTAALAGADQLVLLVEDDPQVRRATAALLETLGFQVLQAESGVDGLAAVRERHVELACVLTDVVMPGMGGGPFIQQVRAEHPDLPVVVTSGYVDDPRVGEEVERHGLPFLPKPFTGEQLAFALREALESRPSSARPRPVAGSSA